MSGLERESGAPTRPDTGGSIDLLAPGLDRGESTDLVAASRQVLATHARSFRWGSIFLPASQRDDAAVVYAFCRMVDDLVDEATDLEAAGRELDLVRAEMLGQRAPRPLVAVFLEVAERREIELAWALELIRGVQSDTGRVRVADDGELLRYCYRVAGTVGLLMCGVLGVRARDAHPHAIDLGIAMQITNICRDVKEDAGIDRIYLPASRLRAAGCVPETLIDGSADRKAVAAVVRDLLELAERYYRSADEGLRFIPRRSRTAIVVAGRIYRAIGLRLRRRGCDALAGRTVVPWTGKLYWLGRAMLALVHPRIVGVTRKPPHDPALHRGLEGLPGTDTAG